MAVSTVTFALIIWRTSLPFDGSHPVLAPTLFELILLGFMFGFASLLPNRLRGDGEKLAAGVLASLAILWLGLMGLAAFAMNAAAHS